MHIRSEKHAARRAPHRHARSRASRSLCRCDRCRRLRGARCRQLPQHCLRVLRESLSEQRPVTLRCYWDTGSDSADAPRGILRTAGVHDDALWAAGRSWLCPLAGSPSLGGPDCPRAPAAWCLLCSGCCDSAVAAVTAVPTLWRRKLRVRETRSVQAARPGFIPQTLSQTPGLSTDSAVGRQRDRLPAPGTPVGSSFRARTRPTAVAAARGRLLLVQISARVCRSVSSVPCGPLWLPPGPPLLYHRGREMLGSVLPPSWHNVGAVKWKSIFFCLAVNLHASHRA